MPEPLPRWAPAVCLIALAVLYLSSTSPWVLGGDTPEFATLFADGGVAHPSGYPAYTLWLRAFSAMPAVTPAQGAAVATALHAVLAAGLLYLAARWWRGSGWSALLAVILYATAPLTWHLATQAEVFSLNIAVAAAVVAVAAPGAPTRGLTRCALLGLAAGVGLANHLSCVLVAPLGLAGLWRGARESGRPRAALGLALAAALPGLALYLSLPLMARGPAERLVWGDPTTLRGLVDHALRRDYGTTSLSANPRPPAPGPELAALASTLWQTLRGLGAPLAAIGAWAMLRSREERPATGWYLATLALAGPVFISRFNIVPEGVGRAVVERFHLLPAALLVPLVARGFDLIVQRVELRPALRLVVIVAAGAMLTITAWPSVNAEHGPDVERYLLDALDTAPPRAVIFGASDDLHFGIPYAQRALGLRRDVVFINPALLVLDTYRRRVERRLGAPLPAPVNRNVSSVAVAEAVLRTGRPLLLAESASQAIVRTLPTYPDGLLLRVLPRGEVPAPLSRVLADTERHFARYRVQPGDELPTTPWLRGARERYARPWLNLAMTLTAAGRPDLAALLRERGRRYAPWLDVR